MAFNANVKRNGRVRMEKEGEDFLLQNKFESNRDNVYENSNANAYG